MLLLNEVSTTTTTTKTKVAQYDSTDHGHVGPSRGVITAHADADITLVDLRCTEAQGSTLILLLLSF